MLAYDIKYISKDSRENWNQLASKIMFRADAVYFECFFLGVTYKVPYTDYLGFSVTEWR